MLTDFKASMRNINKKLKLLLTLRDMMKQNKFIEILTGRTSR